jgi:hypothetical protein
MLVWKTWSRNGMHSVLQKPPRSRPGTVKMLKESFHFAAIAFLVLLVGCTHDVSGQAALRKIAEAFVPPDATEEIVAPNLPWLQISFNVRRPWLQFAFDERRIKDAQLGGWKLCRPTTEEWEGYEDHAVTPPNYRQLRTYILYKDGVSIQFFGMYNRPLNSLGAGSRDDTPIQQGIIIARKETTPEALQMAENFHLYCDAPAAAR